LKWRGATSAGLEVLSWPQSYVRYIQYVWSRYQAHIALFSPIHFDTPAESIPSEEWNRAAKAVLEQFGPPPFGTLVGNNANPSSLRNWGHVDRAPWLGFHQIGNRRTHDCYAYLTEIFQAKPPLPHSTAGHNDGWKTPCRAVNGALYCRRPCMAACSRGDWPATSMAPAVGKADSGAAKWKQLQNFPFGM
jgi:hypothetical protein